MANKHHATNLTNFQFTIQYSDNLIANIDECLYCPTRHVVKTNTFKKIFKSDNLTDM